MWLCLKALARHPDPTPERPKSFTGRDAITGSSRVVTVAEIAKLHRTPLVLDVETQKRPH
jgi:hypothetical protein